jgi:F0F1-type ATP synthase membrane subunit b/b'
MKKLAAFLLLIVFSCALATPAVASRHENRSIGENSKEARKASRQQQKYARKQAKRQNMMMKKYQKILKHAGKHHH